MSKQAKNLEVLLRLIKMRAIVSNMMRNPKRNSRFEEPPKSFYKKYVVYKQIICNQKCFTIKSSDNANKHIFYFHGGAYTLQAQKMHWRIIKNILDKTPCEITFVNYPITPEFTCKDTIDMVTKAYLSETKNSKQKIILMGDSAGGGLALSLAQFIKAKGFKPIPNKIVLFSPWLDLSMDNSISKEQQEKDLILDTETLKIVGRQYAGDYNIKDYLCSPFYGDTTEIGEIALFTGTSEILNAQAVQLKEKLLNFKQSVSYYEYENMQHVWIGFPIPEAKEAIEKAVSFIEK